MFIYFWKYSQGGGRANIALSMLNVCTFIACRFAPLQAPGTCVDAPRALGAYWNTPPRTTRMSELSNSYLGKKKCVMKSFKHTQLAIQVSSYIFFLSKQTFPFSRVVSLVFIASGSRMPQLSRQEKYSSRTFQHCCRSRRDGGLFGVSVACFDMAVIDVLVDLHFFHGLQNVGKLACTWLIRENYKTCASETWQQIWTWSDPLNEYHIVPVKLIEAWHNKYLKHFFLLLR